MEEKDFLKKQLKKCLEGFKNFDGRKEEDYDTIIGYCNLIIAYIKEIQSFGGKKWIIE